MKPSMVAEQARSKQFANTTEIIPEKDRALILVAADAATSAPTCVKTQVALALRKVRRNRYQRRLPSRA